MRFAWVLSFTFRAVGARVSVDSFCNKFVNSLPCGLIHLVFLSFWCLASSGPSRGLPRAGQSVVVCSVTVWSHFERNCLASCRALAVNLFVRPNCTAHGCVHACLASQPSGRVRWWQRLPFGMHLFLLLQMCVQVWPATSPLQPSSSRFPCVTVRVLAAGVRVQPTAVSGSARRSRTHPP